jgi:peptidoglycan hydrolase CwlO-like protein
VRAISNSV